MKYCLNARQPKKLLEKIEEIKFDYRDRRAIPDYMVKYPQAKIILNHNSIIDEPIEWKDFSELKTLYKDRFVLCLDNLYDAYQAKGNELNFYLSIPVTSFYNLEGMINLGVSYIILGAPLFFELNTVKEYTNIPIRCCANKCNLDYLVRENEITGTWIRPEDVSIYEKYIETIEFKSEDIKQEETYYNIYAVEKRWLGPIDMIFRDLNIENKNFLNSLILPQLAEKRTNCGQKCYKGSSCRICHRVFSLSDETVLREYFNIISRN